MLFTTHIENISVSINIKNYKPIRKIPNNAKYKLPKYTEEKYKKAFKIILKVINKSKKYKSRLW